MYYRNDHACKYGLHKNYCNTFIAVIGKAFRHQKE